MANLYQVWPLMAGVALVTACILFSCLVGFGLVLLLTYNFQALICLWRWMKVLIKREEKGGSIGKKAVLTWTTSNLYSFPQDETFYPPSSTILSRQEPTLLPSVKLILQETVRVQGCACCGVDQPCTKTSIQEKFVQNEEEQQHFTC